MTGISISDLAHSFHLKRQSSQFQSDLGRLAAELTSGRTQDKAKSLAGDFTHLAGIESSLRSLEAYKTSATEGEIIASGMQVALGSIQELTSDLGPGILAASQANKPEIVLAAAFDARQKFEVVVSQLNTKISDRSIFSGNAIGQQALAPAGEILEKVGVAISGLSDANQVVDAIEAWFDPGGGFETDGYFGSDQAASAISIGPGKSTQISVTAADPEVRSVLKAFTLAAIAGDQTVFPNADARYTVLQKAAETMLSSQAGISIKQAEIGASEARIDAGQASNQTQKASFELARQNLLGVDPYEAATELEATRSQLEALYTLTSRLSQLSLMDYLR